MNKVNFDKKERRIIITLMAINCFALFVNYFRLSPDFKYGTYQNETEIYILTDSKAEHLMRHNIWSTNSDGTSRMYEFSHKSEFWPIVKFVDTHWHEPNTKRFRGIFAAYDHTEFIVYTLVIFGFFTVKKLW